MRQHRRVFGDDVVAEVGLPSDREEEVVVRYTWSISSTAILAINRAASDSGSLIECMANRYGGIVESSTRVASAMCSRGSSTVSIAMDQSSLAASGPPDANLLRQSRSRRWRTI
jgi:hypothetical protein